MRAVLLSFHEMDIVDCESLKPLVYDSLQDVDSSLIS